MSYTVQANVANEIQKLSPSAVIDLFELDLSEIIGVSGNYGPIVYFHAGTNGLEENITWQGQEYEAFPIELTGFEVSGKGTIPRPTARIANINGIITSLLMEFNNLIGAKVTRKRTFVKFLDAVNFPGTANPTANSAAEFPEEIYYVSRKALENHIFVELELSPLWDLHGIKLPRRLCVQNVCQWKYRGAECGYWMAPYFAKHNLGYTINASGNQLTITFSGHNLVPGTGIYLTLTDTRASLTGSYSIKSVTSSTFTVDIKGSVANATGTLSATNRFSISDVPIYDNLKQNDVCSRRLSSCKLRWGEDQVLPYGAFPGVGWIR